MTLYRTTGPDAEPVTTAEVKAHLRIDHDGEDALIDGLVRAAREEVEALTGVALIHQTWRMALDDWPAIDIVSLGRHPVREVLSVTVYGKDGEASLVAPSSYQLDAASRPARMHFRERPRPERRLNGVEIDFTAGFGESGADCPDTLKRAIVLLAAHWFEFRAAFDAADQPASYPAGFGRLIAPWRMARL